MKILQTDADEIRPMIPGVLSKSQCITTVFILNAVGDNNGSMDRPRSRVDRPWTVHGPLKTSSRLEIQTWKECTIVFSTITDGLVIPLLFVPN